MNNPEHSRKAIDTRIVELIKQGNPLGAQLLEEVYGEKITKIVYCILKYNDPVAVESVSEKAVEKAIRGILATFDESKGTLNFWISGVARNVAIDYLNMYAKSKREDNVNLDNIACTYQQHWKQRYGDSRRKSIIWTELYKLNDEVREVIEHVIMYDVTLVDYCSITGENYDAVRFRLKRGIIKLRKALIQYEEFSDYR